MGKSDEYIEYDAYMRYLKKVTGEQTDQQKMKDAVLSQTAERTELHMALVLLKRLSVQLRSLSYAHWGWPDLPWCLRPGPRVTKTISGPVHGLKTGLQKAG